MLDRLISGAGAVTDAADRLVRAIGRGAGDGTFGSRPGSVVVAAICIILAGILIFAGVEATDNPTAIALTPGQVAQAEDLGSRTYATLSGSVAGSYVETYTDENGNGTQDAGETGTSWYYYLVDPETRSGVTVRSKISPRDLFTYETSGVVLEDATYLKEDLEFFAEEAASLAFDLETTKFIDATAPVSGTSPVLDLTGELPATMSPVRVAGSRAVSYLETCSDDVNGDGSCQPAEIDLWDVAVYDPESGAGIIVLVDEDPEYTTATFTGMLRRDERDVSDAKTTEGLEFDSLDLDVSDIYLLDEGSTPTSAPLAFGLAAVLGALASVILIGLVGGYLVYRKSVVALPEPATSLAMGERVPVKVTGLLRAGGGVIHVREAEADLVRFQTGGPVAGEAVRSATEPSVAAEPDLPPADTDDVTTTLIIERRGKPEGVAIGLGELQRLSRGEVRPLRGARPAIRATAGTGPLLLSFDSVAERDRAMAELLDESGLTAGESGSAHA